MRLLLLLVFLVSCAHNKMPSFTESDQKAIAEADLIFLGEMHDNPLHHQIQAAFLDALGKRGRLGAIVFEQVNAPDQAILDSVQDVDQLGRDLKWQDSGWPDFAIYRPVFVTAREHKAKLLAGGLPKDKIMPLYKEGYAAAFTAEEIKAMKLEEALPASAQTELKKLIFESHCKMIPEDHAAHMIPVQRARDAALVRAWKNGKVEGKATVFIVGGGHARKDFGAPAIIRGMEADAKIWTLSLTEPGSPMEGAGVYDYQYVTKASERPDPCEEMKQHLLKKPIKSSPR